MVDENLRGGGSESVREGPACEAARPSSKRTTRADDDAAAGIRAREAGGGSGRRTASRIADALSSVSFSSAAGSESYKSVAPARTCAKPPAMRTVRSVSPVFRHPSKPMQPTAPPYQWRGDSSWSSTNWMAHGFGAPVTVTAHVCARKASIASKPSRK